VEAVADVARRRVWRDWSIVTICPSDTPSDRSLDSIAAGGALIHQSGGLLK
jgi:hypothetical protein